MRLVVRYWWNAAAVDEYKNVITLWQPVEEKTNFGAMYQSAKTGKSAANQTANLYYDTVILLLEIFTKTYTDIHKHWN